jgi:hypothetical protein
MASIKYHKNHISTIKPINAEKMNSSHIKEHKKGFKEIINIP